MSALDFNMDVTADVKKAQRYFWNLQNRTVDKAAARSLNRTAGKVQTIARRSVSKKMGLAQKVFKKQIFIAIKANRFRLTAMVQAVGKQINLIEFVPQNKRHPGAFRKRTGVRAKPYGRMKEHRGTFIGRGINSGKMLVFIRKSDDRLPIRGFYGPSVPKTFIQKEIMRALKQEAAATWSKEFARNLKYYIKRL